ncbi:maleylacetate reductase [Rhizobiales bacterium]|uniref:maleylacetate reductase n=1 Tax=Hongsoonwoonella zoysiae TaxID=2821844 RepID=UPI00156073B0|nr:maleylacetate reductase [Hongsoonwoonella zoysiae]NRG16227.1 maleylacetate reductase [Hongsoonwoonella zoysiae]
MKDFIYTGTQSRVIFGSGTLAELPAEAERLGARRILVLTTPQQREQGDALVELLDGRAVGSFDQATMHTPVEITNRAISVASERDVDATVAIGGGSTIGLGKALSLHANLPQIAIPTTYAGSEMTPYLGQSEGGRKTTLRDDRVRPKTVIYDVDLTLSLPVQMSIVSGLNAVAHAMEALYARDGNPVISLMAEEGIRALGQALPALKHDSSSLEGRSDALYGAWLCSTCLSAAGMSLHHKLCHAIGGAYNLPHAETHSIILPHAAAYNASATPDAMARIARALGRTDADGAAALATLTSSIGAPSALRDFGMPEAGIREIARLTVENPYWNPRPIDEVSIRALIARAWSGNPPDATAYT